MGFAKSTNQLVQKITHVGIELIIIIIIIFLIKIIIFLNTFERRGNAIAGLWLHLSIGSLFLWAGFLFDSFREYGNIWDEITSLMKQVKQLKVNLLLDQVLNEFNFDKNLTSSRFI